MSVQILGPLQIQGETESMVPRPRLARLLLGLLALHANKVVPAQSVRYALWADRPPRSASVNLRGYLAELRRLLSRTEQEGIAITAEPGGYCLHSEVGGVDALLFDLLAGQGRTLLNAGDHAGACDRFDRALTLWRGPAFAGEIIPEPLQPDIAVLEMKRQDVLEDAIEARLALGEHRELACELTLLVAQWPLRERLAGQLMLALCRSGRRIEALSAYHELRRQLADELGVVPSADIQQLYHRVLEADLATPSLAG